MVTLVKRLVKGSPLTSSEHDANLTNLDTDITANEAGIAANDVLITALTADKANSGANSDITSLSGLTTDLSIAQGGTASSTASDARTALGVEIGVDVQAHDAQLDDISAITPADGAFVVGDGANLIAESGATARASLGLGTAALVDTGTGDGNVPVLDATGYPAIDGSQITNLPSITYSAIATSTVLATSYIYNDTTGTNTHTLPLLSTTTAGDTITVFISGTARKVIINHHASDSAGAEKWTGVDVGDFVKLVSDGSAWQVLDHFENYYVHLILPADESVAANTNEQLVTMTASADPDSMWSTSTDSLTTPPFTCMMDFNYQAISEDANVSGQIKVDGSYFVYTGNQDPDGRNVVGIWAMTASQDLEIWAHCNAGAAKLMRGVADGSETQVTIKFTRTY